MRFVRVGLVIFNLGYVAAVEDNRDLGAGVKVRLNVPISTFDTYTETMKTDHLCYDFFGRDAQTVISILTASQTAEKTANVSFVESAPTPA